MDSETKQEFERIQTSAIAWRPVVGFERHYEVSSAGTIRSIRYNKVRMLAMSKDSHGYYQVQLWKDKKRRNFLVHRLVAFAFIKTQDGKTLVNHKNGIKTNNRIDNLEWCTASENMNHSYGMGRKTTKGMKMPKRNYPRFQKNRRVSNDGVIHMRQSYGSGNVSQRALAKLYNVNQSLVSMICLRKIYNDVP